MMVVSKKNVESVEFKVIKFEIHKYKLNIFPQTQMLFSVFMAH